MAEAKQIRFKDGTIANFKDVEARNQIQNITNIINSGEIPGSAGGPVTFEIRDSDPPNPVAGQAWIKTS